MALARTHQTSQRMVRASAARQLTLLVIGLLLLTGCSIRNEFREGLETAIPNALLAADLGITTATADLSNDGLAVNLDVEMTFDHGDVSADQLRVILATVVKNTNVGHINKITLFGIDGSVSGTGDHSPSFDDTLLDLRAVGEQLGFDAGRQDSKAFVARWGDVVAYLKGSQG